MAVLETMQRRGVVGDEEAKAIEVEVVDARFERMDVKQQFATACDADVSCQFGCWCSSQLTRLLRFVPQILIGVHGMGLSGLSVDFERLKSD
jgi:hypothetical protein